MMNPSFLSVAIARPKGADFPEFGQDSAPLGERQTTQKKFAHALFACHDRGATGGVPGPTLRVFYGIIGGCQKHPIDPVPNLCSRCGR
jgi:hypothetical protein